MNVNINAARLPVGLLVAAGLVHFAPQYATGPGLLALAVGAFAASVLKLKGIGSLVGLVVVAAVFAAVTGLGSPGLDQLGDRLPTSTDDLASITDGVGR